jgi:hypothetical protein
LTRRDPDPLDGLTPELRNALEAASLSLLVEADGSYRALMRSSGPGFPTADIKALLNRGLLYRGPTGDVAATHRGRTLAELSRRRRKLAQTAREFLKEKVPT